MTLSLATRADLSLDAVRRVAWQGEGGALAPAALVRIDDCHAAFEALVAARLAEDPGALIYGTTTAPGGGAAVALTPEAQARRPTRLWAAHPARRRCGRRPRAASRGPSGSCGRSCSRGCRTSSRAPRRSAWTSPAPSSRC